MTWQSDKTTSVAREVAMLLDEWQQGRLTRRAVIRRAVGLGLSVSALAALVERAGTGQAKAAVLRAAQDEAPPQPVKFPAGPQPAPVRLRKAS